MWLSGFSRDLCHSLCTFLLPALVKDENRVMKAGVGRKSLEKIHLVNQLRTEYNTGESVQRLKVTIL